MEHQGIEEGDVHIQNIRMQRANLVSSFFQVESCLTPNHHPAEQFCLGFVLRTGDFFTPAKNLTF